MHATSPDRTRQLGMLEKALQPSLCGSDESVRDRVLEREAAIEKYETASGTAINDDVQIAIMLKAVSEEHRKYFL